MSKGALSKGVNSLTLVLICVLSFSLRLFSVVKYESVIHEFDPYFNYRVTKFLSENGFYSLWNWFDDQTWYPLGRVIGGTVYPGLIYTAGVMYKVLHFLNIPIHVQEVCVFTAPLFSALCALACYGLVRQARGPGAALLAALFMGTVPTYMSRSVGGSYDNEGVAIFALVYCFYRFVKAVNTGTLLDAMFLCLAYLYMVMSWGGYSFVINLLPLYALVMIVFGRMSARLYIAFAPLVAIGTLCACSIPVVGFNAVLMSEHFGSFLVFGVMHVYLFIGFIRRRLSRRHFQTLLIAVLLLAAAVFAFAVLTIAAYVLKSPTLGWTGRSMTLLDPTYASRFVPIIASVSEHQPTQWSSYLMDLHILVTFAPLGLISCIRTHSDATFFLVMYGLTAAYFSGVMIRLMLVLGPAVCCLAAVGISDILNIAFASIKGMSLSTDFLGMGMGGEEGEERGEGGERGEGDKAKKGGRSGGSNNARMEGEKKKEMKILTEGKKKMTTAQVFASLDREDSAEKTQNLVGGNGGEAEEVEAVMGGGEGGEKGGREKEGSKLTRRGKSNAATGNTTSKTTTLHALNSEKAEDDSSSARTSMHSAAVTTAFALTLSSRFGRLPVVVVAALVTLVLSLLTLYILHCVHASADMYSSPSIMILSQTAAGKYVIDDFREAYAWLRHNTAPNAKVASWWDYGYQTSAMAERTVIVDNNTWNTSHIATVGTAMSSPEAKAWAMFRALDVEYVFVVFGGLIGYSGDDINKFLWMVRIGGGVYPEIKEADYLANGQEYRVDQMGAKALLNSLVYRMSYLDFAEASEMWTGKRGFDRVRQVTVGKMDFKMTYFEEAFTSHHWMMRIFRVRDKPLKNLKNPAVSTAKGGRAKPKK